MTTTHCEDLDFISFPTELSAATLPAEDQSAFVSLSTNEIPGWADARAEEYRRRRTELEAHIVTLHSLRNTSAPILRLPNEVLGTILSDSSLKNGDLCIRNVCRRWRSVFLSTPQIWVNRISRKPFDHWPLSREPVIRIALRRSGALPLSIVIATGQSDVWSFFSPHRARIAELAVQLDTYSSVVVNFLHSGRMNRLHTLRLQGTRLRPRTLIAILGKCPRLRYLDCDILTLARVFEKKTPNAGEHAVHLPQLSELAVRGEFSDVVRLIGLFEPVFAHTLLSLRFTNVDTDVGLPSFNLPQVYPVRLIDRLCIESAFNPHEGWVVEARAYVGSGERLRISGQTPVLSHLKYLFRTISILIINLNVVHDELCERITKEWDLPYLRRLEISQRTPTATKRKLTALFLDRLGHQARELSVVWVYCSMPGQKEQMRVAAELESLAGLLQDHINRGRPRLGRLELYAVDRYDWWKTFTGSIETGSDATLCAEGVEPFLARLQDVADVVHVG